MIDEKKILEELEAIRENKQYDAERHLHNRNEFMEYGCNCEIGGIDKAIYLIEKQPQVNQWIPVLFECDEYNAKLIQSPLPEDEENIIITDGKNVWTDVFMRDGSECYLDSGWDIGKITAWQSLPEPYKGDEK